MGKPYEFWIALVAGVLLVIERHKEKTMFARVLIASISGGIGYSMAPEAALWTGRSETLAVMLLTAFGYLAMDILTGIIADREFVKQIILQKLGGKRGDD